MHPQVLALVSIMWLTNTHFKPLTVGLGAPEEMNVIFSGQSMFTCFGKKKVSQEEQPLNVGYHFGFSVLLINDQPEWTGKQVLQPTLMSSQNPSFIPEGQFRTQEEAITYTTI